MLPIHLLNAVSTTKPLNQTGRCAQTMRCAQRQRRVGLRTPPRERFTSLPDAAMTYAACHLKRQACKVHAMHIRRTGNPYPSKIPQPNPHTPRAMTCSAWFTAAA